MGSGLVKEVHALNDSKVEFVDNNIQEDSLEVDIPVVVKNVHIHGIAKTQDTLVTNQLKNVFQADSFEALMQEAQLGKLKLERLGIFSGVEVLVDVCQDGSKDGMDVYYILNEKRKLSANVGTDVGANEGGMNMNANLNNLRGLGEGLRASLSYGTRVSSSYEFSFTKPFVSDSDKKFSFQVKKSVSDFKNSFYKESTKGVGANLQLPSKIGMHNLGFDFMWRENEIYPNAPFEVREDAGHTLKSSVKHTYVSDGRDDYILPSAGHLLKHIVEYSGIGGNVNAVKSDLSVQLNKEIFQHIFLAGSLQAGVAKSLTSYPLLINDRVFLGGPTSVRGFGINGIGRHSGLASLGGEGYWAAGLHLYTPLPFRPGKGNFGELFRLHLFMNAGNLADINQNFDAKNFLTTARYSYGIGLMMMLGGIARLEVNYCIPRNGQPGDIISEGLQVGVGMNFL